MYSLSFRYDMLGLAENVDDYDYGLKSALEHLNDDILPKDNNSSSESAVKQDQETTNKENEEPKPGTSKEGTTAVKKSVESKKRVTSRSSSRVAFSTQDCGSAPRASSPNW